jgi:hypothetical protein
MPDTIKLPLRARSNLATVARNPSLRIDAKQAAPSCRQLDAMLDSVDTFFLNEFLPEPFVKGVQPIYLADGQEDGGAAVVSTLAVRPLSINFGACRRISGEAFEALSHNRKLRNGDVLLTTDGGTSIGKAAVFVAPLNEDGDPVEGGFTVDSHVAILRPRSITPVLLAYLLCSPMGQLQFQRAESGASGQTAVSEEDVRRFRFPRVAPEQFEAAARSLTSSLDKARRLELAAHKRREKGWNTFEDILMQAEAGDTRPRIQARARPSETRLRQMMGG